MAVREIKTTIALDGEQEFKRAIEGASREMRVMDSELKAVTAAYRANGDSAEYFAAKQKNLRNQISQQENIVKSLEQAVEDTAKAYGAGSKEVDGYTIKLNNARTRLSNLEKQLSETDREVEELGRDSIKAGRQIEQGIGDGAREAEQDVKSLVDTMKDDLASIRTNTAFTAMGNLWNVASGAFSAATSFVDGTKELRMQLSFLEQNAATQGLDFGYIKDQMIEIQALTGNSSSAVEGLSNLLATGMDEDRLAKSVNLLAGAVISFPETMKFESLADSLQETIATGEATGQFAELLGRLGVDVNDFNTALDNSETEAGDLDIALAYLSANGLQKVYDQWQENNKSMQDAGETQAELEMELAEFGGTLEEYIVTPVKKLLVEALNWVNETVETAEQEGIEAAGAKALRDAKIPETRANEWDAGTIGSSVDTNRRILQNNISMRNALLEAGAKIWKNIEGMEWPEIDLEKVAEDMSYVSNMVDKEAENVEKRLEKLVDKGLMTSNQRDYLRSRYIAGASVDEELLEVIGEYEKQGAQAADAYFNGFEREIQINTENAKPVTFTGPDGKVIDLNPIGVAKDVNQLLKDLGIELKDSEDDLKEAGEEAGNAMTGGFETAFAALEKKAYAAGTGMSSSYADGINSQVGAISSAVSRMSAAAAAALSAARATASRPVVLEMDGRKVAEGIIPYSDQLLATEDYGTGGYRVR